MFDPDDIAIELFALHPYEPGVAELFVQDIDAVGTERFGHLARPVTQLSHCAARTVLVARFDARAIVARLRRMLPDSRHVISLDDICLPPDMLTNPRDVLDKLNFATTFALFATRPGFLRCCTP